MLLKCQSYQSVSATLLLGELKGGPVSARKCRKSGRQAGRKVGRLAGG